MTLNETIIVKQLCKAIKNWQFINFFYNKETKTNLPDWRLFEPYIVGAQENGNIIVSGWFLPNEEQAKRRQKPEHKNYTIKDISNLKILPKKFDTIKISDDRILNTKLKVICKII